MASKIRSVAVGIGYALGGGVLVGAVGIVIGITLAPDDGLQAVFNAVVGGVVGGLVGGILGVVVFVAGSKALEGQGEAPRAARRRVEATSSPEELDPYDTIRPPSGASLARFIGRGIAVLVGGGIGFYGMTFYVLRCFSTCPTDPAENALSHILPLSFVAVAAAVITAAVTIGTRATIAGTWIITGLGVLLPLGGVAALLLTPSLPFPAERTGIVMFGVIAIAVGVGLVLFGRWVRRRSDQESA